MSLIKIPYLRTITSMVMISLIFQIISPIVAKAITGGPSQPEFTNFESVMNTNMVNEFDGSFTYNLPLLSIPGPNNSSYPISISYHSGVQQSAEASWVGFGWTLNPGSIVRNVRGFPDEYKDTEVIYWNKTRPSVTVSASLNGSLEAFSYEKLKGSISAETGITYNNYSGIRQTQYLGVNLNSPGLASLNYGVDETGEFSGGYSVNISPAELLGINDKIREISSQLAQSIAETEPTTSQERTSTANSIKNFSLSQSFLNPTGSMLSNFITSTYADNIKATNTIEYNGVCLSGEFSVQGDPLPVPLGGKAGIKANMAVQTSVAKSTENVYGYMYSADVDDKEKMMDYYVEKEDNFNLRDKFLAIPFSNADNYSVTGEGIQGGFRLYNRRAGHFRPNYKESKTIQANAGVSLHLGTDIGAGVNASGGQHTLEIKEWDRYSDKFDFVGMESEEYDEPYFFRFNNDLGGCVDFSYGPGLHSDGHKVIKAEINSKKPNIPTDFTNFDINDGKRGGRSSNISYNTIGRLYNEWSELNQYVDKNDEWESNEEIRVGPFVLKDKMPTMMANEKAVNIKRIRLYDQNESDLTQILNIPNYMRAYEL